jgi:hypothetical protein
MLALINLYAKDMRELRDPLSSRSR